MKASKARVLVLYSSTGPPASTWQWLEGENLSEWDCWLKALNQPSSEKGLRRLALLDKGRKKEWKPIPIESTASGRVKALAAMGVSVGLLSIKRRPTPNLNEAIDEEQIKTLLEYIGGIAENLSRHLSMSFDIVAIGIHATRSENIRNIGDYLERRIIKGEEHPFKDFVPRGDSMPVFQYSSTTGHAGSLPTKESIIRDMINSLAGPPDDIEKLIAAKLLMLLDRIRKVERTNRFHVMLHRWLPVVIDHASLRTLRDRMNKHAREASEEQELKLFEEIVADLRMHNVKFGELIEDTKIILSNVGGADELWKFDETENFKDMVKKLDDVISNPEARPEDLKTACAAFASADLRKFYKQLAKIVEEKGM